MQVNWLNVKLDKFSVSTGVKQGACISLNLVCIYIDELFDRLKKSGSYIGSTFSGALRYARTHIYGCVHIICIGM